MLEAVRTLKGGLPILTALYIAWLAPSAGAATNTVTSNLDDGSSGTLRQMVSTSAPGDTINFSANLSGSTILLTNGQIAFYGSLTVDASALPAGIQINGNSSTRIFWVDSGEVVLNSLRLSNGVAIGSGAIQVGAPMVGGAIYNNTYGTLTLINCTLSGNQVTGGNGQGGTNTVYPIGGNGGSGGLGGGGAIYNIGWLNLTNCTLSGNQATGGSGGSGGRSQGTGGVGGPGGLGGGGAIYNDNGVTLVNCTLYGNQVTGGDGGGGGVGFYKMGNGGNGGASMGGAIYNSGGLNLINCTLFNNQGSHGGTGGSALGFSYPPPDGWTVLSGVDGTTGQDVGGGIYNQSAMALTSCTLSSNSASNGGGIYTTYGTTELTNCIVANNSVPPGVSGADINNSSTLSYGGANIAESVTNASGTISGTTPINADPDLAPPGNYGGPTLTMPLLPGSPAIDAGDDFLTNSFTTDQRGYPRLAGLHVDIGAVEGVYSASGPGQLTAAYQPAKGGFQLSFTNLPDANFPVFATTNANVPVSLWPRIGFATETPAGSGRFQFNDPGISITPQRFYLIRSP
ncbi:MAG TPA: choice-of-anchor Q domain-containing protein [Candidatus Acidoferrum sp.]|jgi:predicted outer membrane repeat protein|nr:choice-of-anchor Q domain-containing protein [Candidatus Acidoferrum sp.]